MKVPEEIRKTVGFIAFENKTNGDIVPVGSFFFLGHEPRPGETTSPKVYAVTAKHVIDGLRRRGVEELILRLNPKAPEAPLITEKVRLADWFFHPSDKTVDVAIYEKGISAEVDHLAMPLSLCVTKANMKEDEVELGEEVFISGLFSHHFGQKRNIPIVRTGNLSAFDDERIFVGKFGNIEGFLVEARSTGGLSGSPAFLNLGSVRVIGGELKVRTGQPSIRLLGLVHGHFAPRGKHSSSRDDRLNAGIAIIVSVSSILSVIKAYEDA